MRAEYWGIASFALAICEVLMPGTFLVFFALGALCAAVCSLISDSFSIQLATFAISSLVALIFGTSLYRKMVLKGRANRLGAGPIGERGVVEERIVNGRGKVRVRDISWLATGPDMDAGTPVIVNGRDGTLLVVRAL